MMKPIVVATFNLVVLASLAACGPSQTATPTEHPYAAVMTWGVPYDEPTDVATPTPSPPTPTPSATPIPPTPTPSSTPDVVPGEPSELEKMLDGAVKKAINRIPGDRKIWVDEEVVVYVLAADPHDLEGDQVAVVQHLPSGAILNYDTPGAEPFGQRWGDHPDGQAQVDRMAQDPEVADAVSTLLERHRPKERSPEELAKLRNRHWYELQPYIEMVASFSRFIDGILADDAVDQDEQRRYCAKRDHEFDHMTDAQLEMEAFEAKYPDYDDPDRRPILDAAKREADRLLTILNDVGC